MSKQVIRNGVYYGTIDDMVEQILADAAVIKAAEELAEAVQAESDADGISLFMRDVLAAFRKAQEAAK